ncbi:Clavaminate synthase-like protein [Acorus gramineus]|uniref:Clavaminate synthase-like protein n=1 Tax=Acorus gramineus TaxID=55184 RepID=A0AAV9BS79_ACOGR|nr:Clavaminate synthase-like protein [Acorus gramineus]
MEAMHEDHQFKFRVGECKGQKTIDGEVVPMVLNPKEPHLSDTKSLLTTLKANKGWFEDTLLKNSAVLLRGFDVRNAEDFNDVVEAFGWDDIRYVGPAPRTHVHKRVWTANEGPLSEFIYYHHEMVLIKEFPTKVILFCELPPPEGGETPFVPSFKVTEKMVGEFPEEVREMEEKGLSYAFFAPSKNKTSSMRGRGWEDAFGTSDRAEAERRGKALGMDVEWLPDGGAKTILRARPLTRVFPDRKGRRMWFNTIVGMHGKEISSATMADGTKIPSQVVKRCEEIIEEESIQFKWERGDSTTFASDFIHHLITPLFPD